jgi:hypothetical protein
LGKYNDVEKALLRAGFDVVPESTEDKVGPTREKGLWGRLRGNEGSIFRTGFEI